MAGDMLVLARLLCWLALEDFGAEMDVGHHLCLGISESDMMLTI